MKVGAMWLIVICAVSGFCSTDWPNEPAGAVNMLDCGFNNPTCDGRLWDLYGSGSVVAQPDAPFSPTSAHVWRLAPNAATGGGNLIWPANTRPEDKKPLRELYIGLWWKMSADYQGSGNGANKIMYIKCFNYPFGAYAVNSFLYARGTQGAPSFEITWAHNTSGLDNSHACAYDKGLTCFNNAGSVPILRDKWYRIEVYIKASTTITARDGTMRWWVNNTLVGNYTNLNIGSGIINEVNFDPVWDGTFTCATRDCSKEWRQYYDHVRISAPNGTTAPYYISTGTLPSAQSGRPYIATLQATGGKSPYAWSIISGSLLPGLSLNKSTGVISGTPTTGGRCDFTVKVLDANVPPAEATKALSIVASGSAGVAPRGELFVAGLDRIRINGKAGAVAFQMPQPGKYTVSIFDFTGREVWKQVGTGEAIWSHGGKIKKGVYMVRAEQNGRILNSNYCNIQ